MGGRSTTLVEAIAMNKIVFAAEEDDEFLGINKFSAGIPYRLEEKSVEFALRQYLNLSESDKRELEIGGEKFLSDVVGSLEKKTRDIIFPRKA
jgi:hypothetical protein